MLDLRLRSKKTRANISPCKKAVDEIISKQL